MYFVERSDSKVIVKGPHNFEKSFPAEGISLVFRAIGDLDPAEFAVRYGNMTDEELVAHALGAQACPYQFAD